MMNKNAMAALAIVGGAGLVLLLSRKSAEAAPVQYTPFPGDYNSPIPLMDRVSAPEHWEPQIAKRIAFYPTLPDMPENTPQAAPTQYP
jgi:hypothetical protein